MKHTPPDTARNRRPSVEDEVERYLRTGDTDPYPVAWAGQDRTSPP